MFAEAMRNSVPVVFYSIRYQFEEIPCFHDLKSGFLAHLMRHQLTQPVPVPMD